MWVAQAGFGLPELWVHKSPQSPGVCHSHLWALLVKGLWMVSLEVGISPQTDELSLVWSEQAESWFYSGSHPSWVREERAIVWNELLGLVSKAEPVVPKQLEKPTRWPGQMHRTCQNVRKGELELFVGIVRNVRAKGFNLRVHGIHPCDRINFYKCQILAHTGLMEPKLGCCTLWLAQLMSVVSLCCCQGTLTIAVAVLALTM